MGLDVANKGGGAWRLATNICGLLVLDAASEGLFFTGSSIGWLILKTGSIILGVANKGSDS